MQSARFLIVGGAMTADAAANGIRERDADGPHRLEPNRQGTVAYVDEARRSCGLLSWNVCDRVERGRELVGGGSLIDRAGLASWSASVPELAAPVRYLERSLHEHRR